MDHVFWANRVVDHGCRLSGVEGFPDNWMISDGLPMTGRIPSDASLSMSANFPDDTMTPDFLRNGDGFILVSTRLKELLEAEPCPAVEYLEIAVRDHKAKRVRPPYFIVNPLGTISILRLDQCGVVMDEMVESKIARMQFFVVDDDIAATAPPLFRAAHLSEFVMIARSLARKLDAAGLTGSRWINPTALAHGGEIGLLTNFREEAEVTP